VTFLSIIPQIGTEGVLRAHGSTIAGISGNSETGAYSVVTSGGAYEELDEDRGNVLYYSGSRSHDNTNPKKPFPSSAGTLALKASQRTQRSVRVLRAAGAGGSRSGSSWRPCVGIRYDGLYRVAAMQLKTNMNGGLYEQFKLVREDGQPALDNKSRPSAAELRDYYKREDGY
jgi:choline dehydrogenase-like flavoprotein